MNIKSKSSYEIIKSKPSKRSLISNIQRKQAQASRRLGRLQKHYGKKAQVVRNNKELLKDIDFENASINELSGKLAQLNKFLGSKSSYLKGYKQARQDTINVFWEQGFTFLNDDNLDDFLQFMDAYRELDKTQYLPPSDDVIDVFQETQRLKIDVNDVLDNLNEYADRLEQLQKKKAKKGDGFTSKDYGFRF